MHIRSQPKALDRPNSAQEITPNHRKTAKNIIISKYNRIKGPSFKKKHSKGSSS